MWVKFKVRMNAAPTGYNPGFRVKPGMTKRANAIRPSENYYFNNRSPNYALACLASRTAFRNSQIITPTAPTKSSRNKISGLHWVFTRSAATS